MIWPRTVSLSLIITSVFLFSQIPRSGHRLTLKKGRRSRNRFENERALFAATVGGEFDPDRYYSEYRKGETFLLA